MTNTDITTTSDTPRDLVPGQYELIKLVAQAMHASRYYVNQSSPERSVWLALKAYELGFPATAAPEVIDDIQGRLTLKPQAAWAIVLRSGLLEDMKVIETADSCEIQLKRKGMPFWQGYTFTMDAAKAAGLIKPDGAYAKWSKNMLYWRALGFAIDRVFPDVTLGLKDNIQFGAELPVERVTIQGEIIEQ